MVLAKIKMKKTVPGYSHVIRSYGMGYFVISTFDIRFTI